MRNVIEQIDLLNVESELLLEIGYPEGAKFLSYPKVGEMEERNLVFLDHSLTKTILKRPETQSFPLLAPFSREPISGDPLCKDANGNTIITQDGQILRFNFNPFYLHLWNISENFHRVRTGYRRNLMLFLYFRTPGFVRDALRTVARKIKNYGIQSLKDLHVLSQSSNIIVNLFEDHLSNIGTIERTPSKFSAVLSHDIDIDFCQTKGYTATSSIEDDEGVKSTWFFVPKSRRYKLNKTTIEELISQGNEIGLHGLTHSGTLNLRNPEILRKQIREGRLLLSALGAKVESFRSPFMLRSPTLLKALDEEGFTADSSYPDIDTLGLTGGLPGVHYNRPFRPILFDTPSQPIVLNLWEMPSSTPQDVQIIEDLSLDDDQVVDIWKYKAEFCKDYRGVFVHHSHPWFIANKPETYIQIIRHLKRIDADILQMRQISALKNQAISAIVNSA
jgi:peptidoglycan/xylan/chitin deacetylase (PgdA/CDA1 family)